MWSLLSLSVLGAFLGSIAAALQAPAPPEIQPGQFLHFVLSAAFTLGCDLSLWLPTRNAVVALKEMAAGLIGNLEIELLPADGRLIHEAAFRPCEDCDPAAVVGVGRRACRDGDR